MGLHVGHVRQLGQGKTHHALAVVLTESCFCVGHGAVGCSNQIAVGVFVADEAAISKSALMKISGSQNSMGIAGLTRPTMQHHGMPSSREYAFRYRYPR
jgi:hypothetical protein